MALLAKAAAGREAGRGKVALALAPIDGRRYNRPIMIAIVRFLVVASILLAAHPVGADLEAAAVAFERGEYATAYKEYLPAAEEGVPVAQFAIGIMYFDGLHVAQDDRKAFAWLKKAADQGVAAAQHQVGFMYRKGRSVDQSDKEAARWYRKAAEQGFAASQYNLGLHFELGSHNFLRIADYDTAVAWYRMAAAQGDTDALFRLAGLNARGEIGDTVNRVEARRLALVATSQGNEKAKELLRLLEKSALGDRDLAVRACLLMYPDEGTKWTLCPNQYR